MEIRFAMVIFVAVLMSAGLAEAAPMSEKPCEPVVVTAGAFTVPVTLTFFAVTPVLVQAMFPLMLPALAEALMRA